MIKRPAAKTLVFADNSRLLPNARAKYSPLPPNRRCCAQLLIPCGNHVLKDSSPQPHRVAGLGPPHQVGQWHQAHRHRLLRWCADFPNPRSENAPAAAAVRRQREGQRPHFFPWVQAAKDQWPAPLKVQAEYPSGRAAARKCAIDSLPHSGAQDGNCAQAPPPCHICRRALPSCHTGLSH